MNQNKTHKAITVRIPKDEYERLRKYAADHHTSLNSVVAEAVAQYGEKQERAQAIQMIRHFRARLRDKGATGAGSDSVEILHEIREMRSRHDCSGDPESKASGQSSDAKRGAQQGVEQGGEGQP